MNLLTLDRLRSEVAMGRTHMVKDMNAQQIMDLIRTADIEQEN